MGKSIRPSSVETRTLNRRQSWRRETGQRDKWIFCLTAARIAAIQERK